MRFLINTTNVLVLVVIVLVLLVLYQARAYHTAVIPPEPPVTSLPRIEAADLTYVGGCRVPAGQFGVSNFGWSGGGDGSIGGGIAFDPAGHNGAGSLFISGNFRGGDGGVQGSVAEITLCDTWINSATATALQTAAVLQNFVDVSHGQIAAYDIPAGGQYTKLGGLLVDGANLYFTIYHMYDSGPYQQTSHGQHARTLSSGGLGGFDTLVSTTMLRFTARWMANVPAVWQAALGGSAISGAGNLSVIATTSHGPAAWAFTPSAIGGTAGTVVAAQALFYYDNAHETLGSWSALEPNSVYTQATSYGGFAIIPSSRTLLIWGTHASDPCYGVGTNDPALDGKPFNETFQYCYDPNGVDSEGVHGYPMLYQFWAYDLDDLAAVKAGTKQYYEPIPYAHWNVTLPIDQSSKIAGGMTVDPATGSIYVSQYCGEVVSGYCYPILHKYTVRTTPATKG